MYVCTGIYAHMHTYTNAHIVNTYTNAHNICTHMCVCPEVYMHTYIAHILLSYVLSLGVVVCNHSFLSPRNFCTNLVGFRTLFLTSPEDSESGQKTQNVGEDIHLKIHTCVCVQRYICTHILHIYTYNEGSIVMPLKASLFMREIPEFDRFLMPMCVCVCVYVCLCVCVCVYIYIYIYIYI